MSQSLGHDPLCTWRQAEEADAGDPRRWLAGGLAVCDCDLIAKVREDMLAKCIEVVTEMPLPEDLWLDWGGEYGIKSQILTDLRALQEKP